MGRDLPARRARGASDQAVLTPSGPVNSKAAKAAAETVFHLCARLSCVPPRHLRAGRAAPDRLEQAKARGRVPAGADHQAAKLSPGQVRRLRRLKAVRPEL